MAKTLNDNLKISAGKPIDSKYLNQANTTYTGTSQVLSQIPLSERYVGLTVSVNNQEFWFKTGVTSTSLVQKLATASNGLSVTSSNYVLGGALTGNTKITGAAGTKSLLLGGDAYPLDGDRLGGFEVRAQYADIKTNLSITLQSETGLNLQAMDGQVTVDAGTNSPRLLMNTTTFEFLDRRAIKRGIEYAGEYSSGFTNFSLVHKSWVLDQLNGVSGSTFVIATNGLTKNGNYVRLGGTLTGSTFIDANNNSLKYKLSTRPSNATFITGDIGSTLNLPLFIIKSNTGETLSVGNTDIIIGPHTGYTVTTGKTAGNISIGSDNLQKITSNPSEFSGGRNITLGYQNMTGNTISNQNVVIGRRNMNGSGNPSYSVSIGYENGFKSINTANDSHVAIGIVNMYGLTANTGTNQMVAIGGYNMNNAIARDGRNSVAIGNACLLDGDFERYQIAIGDSAGRRSILGRANILIGSLAGADMTGGIGVTTFNIAIGAHAFQYGSGYKSTFVGTEAGSQGVSGTANSGFGNWSLNRTSGSNNTGLGAFAGYHASLVLTGSTNTFIGYQASYSSNRVSNTIVLGHNISVTGSSKVYIGGSSQTTVLGKVNGSSDATNVLVRASNGEVQSRTIGSLNQLNVRVVSAHTTTTSTDHVLLVTTASSGLTVTLRSSPNDGEVVVIKDRSGNANVNNIIINGNAKNIDGSSSAVINTNYGAAKLVYSSTANAWFSIGMII